MRDAYIRAVIILAVLIPTGASADFEEGAEVQIRQASDFRCLENYPCYQLSDQYPQKLPPVEDYPWLEFHFAEAPRAYLDAVLRYVLEGNIAVDWDIARNRVRTWYHAPWMHRGRRGREPIRGLTLERGSRWHELSRHQTRRTNNWAVGFYNPRGAFTIGQVWKDPTNPDSSKAQFEIGTVAAKDTAPYNFASL